MGIVQSMKEILKKPYLVFFSILLFFTPLILVTNTNELFEFPKMFFVYIFGFFVIFFFLSDLLLRKFGSVNNKERKFTNPSKIVLAFVFSTFISTLFSSHLYTSFFGYYTRFNDGFLSYIVYFGLYIVAINRLSKEDLFKLLKISIFSIVPIALYGLAQYFGGPNIFWSLPSVERVYSTLGQPNWLAQYLSILLCVCLFFSLIDTLDRFKIWFFIYSVGFFCLWVTYSMSGLVGFLSSIVVLTFGFFYHIKIKKNKILCLTMENLFIRITLLILITLSISISNLGIFKAKINDIFIDIKKTISVVGKVYALGSEYEISDPGFIRIELWKSTFNLIKSSPKVFFIGTGPETFPYQFQKFRSTKLNYSSEWEYVFNKPHNYYLELWSESGIITLVIYLILLYTVIKNISWFLIPSLTAFIVTNIFGWPTVSTSILFWFFIIWSEVWRKK